jgi:uncharacterized protein YndB with AHSA1/START domain
MTDCIAVTTIVEVAPAAAFEIFTAEVDAWWRRGPRFRRSDGPMRFEPGPGGALYEGATELGRVLAWEPPARLVFTWRGADFAPDESTEVEVRFDPDPRGTRVSVQHRGWDALADAHRARHGLGKSGAFTSMVGLWWADLFTELKARRAGRAPAA